MGRSYGGAHSRCACAGDDEIAFQFHHVGGKLGRAVVLLHGAHVAAGLLHAIGHRGEDGRARERAAGDGVDAQGLLVDDGGGNLIEGAIGHALRFLVLADGDVGDGAVGEGGLQGQRAEFALAGARVGARRECERVCARCRGGGLRRATGQAEDGQVHAGKRGARQKGAAAHTVVQVGVGHGCPFPRSVGGPCAPLAGCSVPRGCARRIFRLGKRRSTL